MAEELEHASEDLVEKAKADKAKARGPVGKVSLFLRQVVGELKKVTRPTVAELRNYTAVVIGFVVVVILVIGAFDWLFFKGVVWTFSGQ
ncbi:MAG: hypothetical protein RLZZ626_87 [Actinomycetota bacterium]|jgi:preprotein translocase subunit SecE